jgi:hypothetical protein
LAGILVNPRLLSAYVLEISTISDLVYYAFNYLGKGLRRTLGEEYVEIGLAKQSRTERSDFIYDSDYYKDEVARLGPRTY